MAENSIFKTKQESSIHHYPLYLNGSAENQGEHGLEQARECIQFTAVKQPGVSFNKDFVDKKRLQITEDIQRSLDFKANGIDSIGNGSRGSTDITEKERKSRNASDIQNAKIFRETGRAVIDKTLEQTSIFAGAKEFLGDASNQVKNGNIEELEDCFLYMPSSVVFNEGASWQKEELGTSGNAIKSALTGSKSISSILQEFGAGMATPLAKTAAVGTAALLTGAIGGLLTIVGGGGIESGIKQTTRLTQNPYEEQLFNGIDFRVFSFNFEFAAVSEEEFRAVQNIITMFRKHSRPTFTISDGNQALYSYPNEFAIKFLHLETSTSFGDIQGVASNQFVENTNLPKLHNCVLTNITTNYAPDGWKAHKGGEPNLINVQLAFTETKKNTRTDIEKGY